MCQSLRIGLLSTLFPIGDGRRAGCYVFHVFPHSHSHMGAPCLHRAAPYCRHGVRDMGSTIIGNHLEHLLGNGLLYVFLPGFASGGLPRGLILECKRKIAVGQDLPPEACCLDKFLIFKENNFFWARLCRRRPAAWPNSLLQQKLVVLGEALPREACCGAEIPSYKENVFFVRFCRWSLLRGQTPCFD